MIAEDTGRLTMSLKKCKSRKELRGILAEVAVREGVVIDPRKDSPDEIAGRIGLLNHPDSRKILRETLYRFF